MFAILAAALAILQPALSAPALDRLIEASAKAITARAGSIRGEALGRFDTPIGQAQAFRTDFSQGDFRRRYVFLIRPTDPGRGPISVMLSSDTAVDQMARARGHQPPLFVDLYSCNIHATLDMIPREPSFEELRALVVAKLQNAGSAISSTEAHGGLACNYGAYVLPGLGGTP
jgi:hypothetical protein